MRSLFMAAIPALVAGTSGIDFAGAISSSTADCLVKTSGFSFGVVRAWHSYGGFDSGVVAATNALWDAGAAHVDVYMFPCAGQSASSQVNSLVSDLRANGVKYGMIWFDIETNPSAGCGWSSNHATNCEYMQELVNAMAANGVNYGTYASEYMWSSIMGGDACKVGGDHALWYAHYDGSPSFNDWVDFGGWTKPAVKQYSGTGSSCGLGVDLDWYPSAAYLDQWRNMNATAPTSGKVLRGSGSTA